MSALLLQQFLAGEFVLSLLDTNEESSALRRCSNTLAGGAGAGLVDADPLAGVVGAALQDELGAGPWGDDRSLLLQVLLRARTGPLRDVICGTKANERHTVLLRLTLKRTSDVLVTLILPLPQRRLSGASGVPAR